jgi:hypothetical protein
MIATAFIPFAVVPPTPFVFQIRDQRTGRGFSGARGNAGMIFLFRQFYFSDDSTTLRRSAAAAGCGRSSVYLPNSTSILAVAAVIMGVGGGATTSGRSSC